MNNDFDFEYNDFDELYESMMETNPEDWLPSTGIREEFGAETLAMLKSFWYNTLSRVYVREWRLLKDTDIMGMKSLRLDL